MRDVSDTGVCVRLQAEPTQVGPIAGGSSYLRNVLRLKKRQDDG
jgi:hypothetical protein